MKLSWTLSMMLGIAGSAWGQTATQPMGQSSSPAPQVHQVGGSMKAPVPISLPDPKFTREARKKKISGTVLVGFIVDEHGNTQQVHVVRSLAERMGKDELKAAAMTLDAKAIEAVKQYKFRPATLDGRAISIAMQIEVNFVL